MPVLKMARRARYILLEVAIDDQHQALLLPVGTQFCANQPIPTLPVYRLSVKYPKHPPALRRRSK